MEVISNSSSDHQLFISEFPPSIRPRCHSAPEERINPTIQSILSSTLSTLQQHQSITNSQSDSQQRRYKENCICGLAPTLREVKKDNQNKGRFFWSCSKFGGPEHEGRCDFFRWDSQGGDVNDAMAESSFTTRNRTEMPNVSTDPVMRTASTIEDDDRNDHDDDDDDGDDGNNGDDGNDGHDGDDGNDGNDDDGDDVDYSDYVDLSPHSDQFSEDETFMSRPLTRTRVPSNPTPITPNRRFGNPRGRTSLTQAPGSPPPPPSGTANNTNNIDTIIAATTNVTGDVYTRKPAVFDNWSDVPKITTPQLLDIMQNHLVKQDNNYKKWYTAHQSAKKDLEEAKKEIEKLKKDLEMVNREKRLCKRENDVLKAEMRLLQVENDGLKEENQDLKRRRY